MRLAICRGKKEEESNEKKKNSADPRGSKKHDQEKEKRVRTRKIEWEQMEENK